MVVVCFHHLDLVTLIVVDSAHTEHCCWRDVFRYPWALEHEVLGHMDQATCDLAKESCDQIVGMDQGSFDRFLVLDLACEDLVDRDLAIVDEP